ncbi:hypothetical protein [Rhizobium oryzicola]|uniref:Cell envelope biogenesis protein OmpA n=1 Tax=Rhizobium oryzicola TaxID=1232668 RepID=A0ABT8SV47_9HYPH|nr:hypothetical protein [Rhizobium oryzicola]MDO1582310.1 hypothetical protein [Rhizobium oryzicola]
MFPTAFTHNVTQFARTLSLPERVTHSPFRNMALETLRRRNATLDSVFYDVKAVTAEEAFYISGCLAAEGAILVVPPTGGPPLRLYDTVDDFIIGGGAKIDVLAVAGVGSSALGSAAFGRNIADAVGRPVAVVISGYGLADVMTEAMGGYFLFGYLNSFRHAFERLDEFFGRPQFGIATHLSTERLCESSLDTQTVKAILSDRRFSFTLLVGHSKGNLVISEALYELAETQRPVVEKLAEKAKIVTLSARIAMPPVFKDVVDVMGEWDWFGEINSRPTIPADEIVPKAWHHTNTELPNHLPVTEILQKVLTPRISATILTMPAPVPAPAAVAIPEPLPAQAIETAPLVVAEPPLPEIPEPVVVTLPDEPVAAVETVHAEEVAEPAAVVQEVAPEAAPLPPAEMPAAVADVTVSEEVIVPSPAPIPSVKKSVARPRVGGGGGRGRKT